MKTLEEHNGEKLKEYSHDMTDKRTKTVCPNCGDELQFTDDSIFTSIQPKRKVKCPTCDYIGFMIV